MVEEDVNSTLNQKILCTSGSGDTTVSGLDGNPHPKTNLPCETSTHWKPRVKQPFFIYVVSKLSLDVHGRHYVRRKGNSVFTQRHTDQGPKTSERTERG